jgi:acetyltransferase-like isoleucine patch superfamily enzyme
MGGMKQLRVLYNRWRRRLARALLYRIVFGERSGGRFLPYTRISPATCIEHEDQLVLGDHVYIGPFNVIDASGGVTIADGVQITSHVAIVSHSSHRAQRLLGEGFVNWPGARFGQRPGWISGPVVIGRYSFIGPHSLIEANTRIGRGTLVCAGSFVRGDYPDFAILEGRPARVVGDSRRADERLLERYPDLRPLYDAWAGAEPAVEPGPAADPADAKQNPKPSPKPADKAPDPPAAPKPKAGR